MSTNAPDLPSSLELELFRRAICERDELAWSAVVARYRDLVRTWVRQHPAASRLSRDEDYWCNAAFIRFWRAIQPSRWAQFADLPSVLRYLKLCAHSVLLDAARAIQRSARSVPLDDISDELPSAVDGTEDVVVGALTAAELWELVLRLLPDASERLTVYLSLVRDMKPAEIRARHPAQFASTTDVYVIKRKAFDRLRRSPELRAWCRMMRLSRLTCAVEPAISR